MEIYIKLDADDGENHLELVPGFLKNVRLTIFDKSVNSFSIIEVNLSDLRKALDKLAL